MWEQTSPIPWHAHSVLCTRAHYLHLSVSIKLKPQHWLMDNAPRYTRSKTGVGVGCGVQAPLEGATVESSLGELEGQHIVPRALVVLYLYLLCAYISHTHTHPYTYTPHTYSYTHTLLYIYLTHTYPYIHIYSIHTPTQIHTYTSYTSHIYSLVYTHSYIPHTYSTHTP